MRRAKADLALVLTMTAFRKGEQGAEWPGLGRFADLLPSPRGSTASG